VLVLVTSVALVLLQAHGLLPQGVWHQQFQSFEWRKRF
jgi:hypothetical protein